MKILSNKFFIIGNLILLLLAIPITLFFVKKQQELRGKAAAASKLYFNPANPTTSTQCQSFDVDLMIDPSSNVVTIVHFYITYDPTKLDLLSIKESDKFPGIVKPATLTSGKADMSVTTTQDVSKYVQSISKVATLTFKPKAEGATVIQIDSTNSSVYNQTPGAQTEEAGLNVLSTVNPANVTVGTAACSGGPGITGTPTPTGNPPAGITPSVTPTPTTAAVNQLPVCTSLTAAPAASGSAPLSVLFTGVGNDPDSTGLITKASFTFGDGLTQDVTTGLNQKSVNVQTSHTYQQPGTFTANIVFTDNSGGISLSCVQNITATQSASGSAQLTPTATPTLVEKPTATPTLVEKPTAAPTAAPTIAQTGSIGQTVGTMAIVLVTLIGGFLLLAL